MNNESVGEDYASVNDAGCRVEYDKIGTGAEIGEGEGEPSGSELLRDDASAADVVEGHVGDPCPRICRLSFEPVSVGIQRKNHKRW